MNLRCREKTRGEIRGKTVAGKTGVRKNDINNSQEFDGFIGFLQFLETF
jgi:hypothetical protein